MSNQSPTSPLIYQIEEMTTKVFETHLQEVPVDGLQAIYVEINKIMWISLALKISEITKIKRK